MHKDPTYLGLFADDGKAARKTVKNYCRDSLIQLSNIQENVAQELALFEEWTFPQDAHHVTTIFVGGKAQNLKQREREIFKTFPQDEKAMISIDLFVYVPGYLMVGYCRSIGEFQCANEHAHVTLMLKNKAKAFQSNEVLETLFRKYPEIAKGVQFEGKCLEVPWREHKVMYVVNRPLQLKAISGSNFKYGNR